MENNKDEKEICLCTVKTGLSGISDMWMVDSIDIEPPDQTIHAYLILSFFQKRN